MTTLDLDDLEKLASFLQDQSWPGYYRKTRIPRVLFADGRVKETSEEEHALAEAKREYRSEFCPRTTLTLIARARRADELEAENAGMRAELERLLLIEDAARSMNLRICGGELSCSGPDLMRLDAALANSPRPDAKPAPDPATPQENPLAPEPTPSSPLPP